MPLTMVRINTVKGVGPVLQLAEGWTCEVPENVFDVINKRTDQTWPTTWFVPRTNGKEGPFKDVYSVMANWGGANHGALSYGHFGLISSPSVQCSASRYACIMLTKIKSSVPVHGQCLAWTRKGGLTIAPALPLDHCTVSTKQQFLYQLRLLQCQPVFFHVLYPSPHTGVILFLEVCMKSILSVWKEQGLLHQEQSDSTDEKLQKQAQIQRELEDILPRDEATLLSLYRMGGARFSLNEEPHSKVVPKLFIMLLLSQLIISQIPTLLGYPFGDNTMLFYGLNLPFW